MTGNYVPGRNPPSLFVEFASSAQSHPSSRQDPPEYRFPAVPHCRKLAASGTIITEYPGISVIGFYLLPNDCGLAFRPSSSLGTVFGDFLSDNVGLGYLNGSLVMAAIIGVVVLLHYYTRINQVLLF